VNILRPSDASTWYPRNSHIPEWRVFFRMSSPCCLLIVSLWCWCSCSLCYLRYSRTCSQFGDSAVRERWCFVVLDNEIQWFHIGILDCKWSPHWPQILSLRSDGPVYFIELYALLFARIEPKWVRVSGTTQWYSYTYSEPWRHCLNEYELWIFTALSMSVADRNMWP